MLNKYDFFDSADVTDNQLLIPQYRGNSIVNLMSSIRIARGGKSSAKSSALVHPELSSLPASEIAGSKNIILLVIDGLGYEFLKRHGKKSFLYSRLRSRMTTVFPTTTSSAIATFVTGLSPQEHAITGWFMYLKEVGIVSAILPFCPRNGGVPFGRRLAEKIFDQPVIYDSIKARSFIVMPTTIVNSDYTVANSGRAKRIGYTKSRKSENPSDLKGMFKAIHKAIRSPGKTLGKTPGKTYVYAYWPDFDTTCHTFGPSSKKALSHFKKMDKLIGGFLRSLEATSTTVIITADHGQIATRASHVVRVRNHPLLKDALILPLCGEQRAAYCYLHPGKARQFERYVKKKLGAVCSIHKSQSLVKKGLFGAGFGVGKVHPKLLDRIGHYILIMKDDYIIADALAGRKEHIFKGIHGGLSKEELFVPLIVAQA